MKRTWLWALVIGFVLVPSVFSQHVRSLNKVPGRIESTAQRLTHQLQRQGYEVARGYFRLYTREDCDYSYGVMQSCFANNPAAPYILPVLPVWSDEWLDPNLFGVFGPTPPGYSSTFRLDPREAIVILGRLPPPAKYFGLQTSLFTREGDFDRDSNQYRSISAAFPALLHWFFTYDPIDVTRIQLLASLGNSINNVVIERASGGAFDRERYFIITPDQWMEQVITNAFRDVGVQSTDLFTEPISSLARVGLEQAADDFYTIIRYAMPDDDQSRRSASQRWREDLPLVVLRVRDRRTTRAAVPYPPVQLEPRLRQEPPETALAGDLTSLVLAVCQTWQVSCGPAAFGQRVWRLVKVQTPPIVLIGPECIAIGMNCLGDTLDAAYAFSPRLPFDGQRVYAVIGALSTATGNATYVGLGVNATKRQQGIDNVSDGELSGSADDYRPVVANSDKFFVYYFARDCTTLPSPANQHCRSIAESDLPDFDPGDVNADQLMVSLRNYVFPGSARGPDAEYVLAPYVIAVR